ncbi:hypothetical protein NQ317_002001 [Molorchus minor]|uniref:Peptidase C1A papain C-terminal domain-containing protein n=1 Tax=Molorchus minor TaxID=1323400 RepID=A0ABQ9ITG7_9CUCU|nr:hypothetical protein NQ317_002001 [Molorchus minor]
MSEQNILDCSSQHDNQGCGGGDMIPAFEYVNVNDGIDSEEQYPYEGHNGVCRYNVSTNVTSLKGYSSIERGNEDYLKAAVAALGPVSVTIDADKLSFHNYASGVHYNSGCIEGIDDPELELNHGVAVVGYGTTDDGLDYWIVKNSWGADWGDNGYIKMARNRDNNCGIASLASVPIMY